MPRSATSSQKTPQVYDNAFLLVFDVDGRCSDFAELYIERPQE